MGLEYFRRPVRARGLQVEASNSTFTKPLVFSGTAGVHQRFETVTASSAAQTLSAYGVSRVVYATSGKPNDILLPAPPAAGIIKTIVSVNNTTSIELNINAPVGTFFDGTTYNTITHAAASTGSPGGTPAGTPALVLVSVSTSAWAVFPGSTFNWDFTKTTGSTAQ